MCRIIRYILLFAEIVGACRVCFCSFSPHFRLEFDRSILVFPESHQLLHSDVGKNTFASNSQLKYSDSGLIYAFENEHSK